MKKLVTNRTSKTLDNNQLARAAGGIIGEFSLVSYTSIISPDNLVSPDSLIWSGGFERIYR